MKKIISTLFCVALAFLAGCSKPEPAKEEFKSLVKCVPADSAFFFGTYCPASFQDKIINDKDYLAALDELKRNELLNTRLKLAATQLSQKTNGASDIILDKNSPMQSIVEMLSKSEDISLVAFVDPVALTDKAKAEAQWTLVARGDFTGTVKSILEKSNDVKKVQKDGRTFFAYEPTTSTGKLFISAEGKSVTASTSIERIYAFEASEKNPPAQCITDAPAFKKIRGNVKHADTQIFINFDKIGGFRDLPAENAFQKSLIENLEACAIFSSSYKKHDEYKGVIRATFKNPIYAMEFIKSASKRKLETLKNSIPDAEYALGIAVPAITPETLTAAKALSDGDEDEEVISQAKQFDLRTVYVSLKDSLKVVNISKSTDIPQAFIKINCGDVDTILENKDVKPMLNHPLVSREKIGDKEIYASLYGVRFAPIGKTGFYVSNIDEPQKALKLASGKGKSLADNDHFKKLNERISGDNVIEFFCNAKKASELCPLILKTGIEYAGEDCSNEDIKFATIFNDLKNALVKKERYAIALRMEGPTMISIPFAAEYKLSFEELAKKIKELK